MQFVNVEAGYHKKNLESDLTPSGDTTTCEICGKSFASGKGYVSHMKYMHDEKAPWYYCDRCNYKAK